MEKERKNRQYLLVFIAEGLVGGYMQACFPEIAEIIVKGSLPTSWLEATEQETLAAFQNAVNPVCSYIKSMEESFMLKQ